MGRKAIDHLEKSFDSGIVLKKVEKEHWGGQTIHYEDAVKMAEKLEMELFGFSRKDYQGET